MSNRVEVINVVGSTVPPVAIDLPSSSIVVEKLDQLISANNQIIANFDNLLTGFGDLLSRIESLVNTSQSLLENSSAGLTLIGSIDTALHHGEQNIADALYSLDNVSIGRLSASSASYLAGINLSNTNILNSLNLVSGQLSYVALGEKALRVCISGYEGINAAVPTSANIDFYHPVLFGDPGVATNRIGADDVNTRLLGGAVPLNCMSAVGIDGNLGNSVQAVVLGPTDSPNAHDVIKGQDFSTTN